MESGTIAVDASGDGGFQVQFLDTKVAATEIRLLVGGELVGEAAVLTFDDDTFLLATMTWRPAGEAAGAAQKRRVCESLVREAVDLADRHGAVLLAMVGAPTVLTALGFEQNGLLWRRAAGR